MPALPDITDRSTSSPETVFSRESVAFLLSIIINFQIYCKWKNILLLHSWYVCLRFNSVLFNAASINIEILFTWMIILLLISVITTLLTKIESNSLKGPDIKKIFLEKREIKRYLFWHDISSKIRENILRIIWMSIKKNLLPVGMDRIEGGISRRQKGF